MCVGSVSIASMDMIREIKAVQAEPREAPCEPPGRYGPLNRMCSLYYESTDDTPAADSNRTNSYPQNDEPDITLYEQHIEN